MTWHFPIDLAQEKWHNLFGHPKVVNVPYAVVTMRLFWLQPQAFKFFAFFTFYGHSLPKKMEQYDCTLTMQFSSTTYQKHLNWQI